MHFLLNNKAVICTEFYISHMYVRESTWSRWMILVESCFFTKRNETKQVFVQFKDSDRFTLVHLKIEFNNSFRNIRSMHNAHIILAFISSRCFKNSYAVSHMCFSLSFFFYFLTKSTHFMVISIHFSVSNVCGDLLPFLCYSWCLSTSNAVP